MRACEAMLPSKELQMMHQLVAAWPERINITWSASSGTRRDVECWRDPGWPGRQVTGRQDDPS